jgi:hypothetical protein
VASSQSRGPADVWEGSSWSARSPARDERARTNELDADERRQTIAGLTKREVVVAAVVAAPGRVVGVVVHMHPFGVWPVWSAP